MPVHHVPSDTLFAFAAGNGAPGEDLLVACHLTLCPDCRTASLEAEAVGAALFERCAAAPLGEGALEAVLQALDRGPPAPEPNPPSSGADRGWAPAPLRALLGPIEQVPWRAVAQGVRVAQVPISGLQRVFLMDFPPSVRIPSHGHHGIERALVLRGGFTDERAAFGLGDVSWRDDAEEHVVGERAHRVTIDADGPCTTLFVNDGPTDMGLLTGLVDRWMFRG